jgi:hypothetical protein
MQLDNSSLSYMLLVSWAGRNHLPMNKHQHWPQLPELLHWVLPE